MLSKERLRFSVEDCSGQWFLSLHSFVYHAAFFSRAAPNTMRKKRKERNSTRENQNKNPREEEGRRVEMGQKKRRLDEKAAKKCFKEFKWFQSVIRRVQTGFSAELRVECALLLLFFSLSEKNRLQAIVSQRNIFINERKGLTIHCWYLWQQQQIMCMHAASVCS